MNRCLAVIAVILLASTAFPQEKPVPLVAVTPGALPIIISAPHGGRLPIPDVKERRGVGVAQFVTVRDTNVDLLAEKLAVELEKRFQAKPHVVIARFDRKYCDANRPPEGAFEDDRAKPHYDAYHTALRTALKQVKTDWGRGLMIDLHGHAAQEDAVFRGTNNRQTVKLLVERFGVTSLTGPDSVMGRLATAGWAPIPANDSTDLEDKRFGGGYIVRTYGSHTAYGIDAIQLETGGRFRARSRLDQSARELSVAVEAFAKAYLPKKPLERQP